MGEEQAVDYKISRAARELHERLITIDGLSGSAMAYNPMLEGGLTAGNITIGLSNTTTIREAIKNCIENYNLIEFNPERLMLVEKADDIIKAKKTNKLGLILGIQGCECLEEDVHMVTALYRMGVRIIQLTYSIQNAFGYGCLEKEDRGITHLGIQVVRECNRLGIVLDLTHLGFRTAMDVAEESQSPVIISHSNPMSVCSNPRCVKDELIKAVAKTGGVMGVTPYSPLAETVPDKWPTLDDVVAHIKYVVDLVGIDHVGFGTDMFEGRNAVGFEGWFKRCFREQFRSYSSLKTRHVQGFSSLRYLPRLTDALLRHGFNERQVAQIMGENFLRVFREVWK
jgi:membrane dipeptidase